MQDRARVVAIGGASRGGAFRHHLTLDRCSHATGRFGTDGILVPGTDQTIGLSTSAELLG